ncbi:MAG: hypothetical protein ACO1G9_08470 [Bacteroidota bacterium]
MKSNLLKIVAVLLLFFNGAGAIYGGGNFILHPDGSSLGITEEWLRYSPFENFLIPGIVLFIVNGVFNFVVIIFILKKWNYYQTLVICAGVLLSGWILIQMIMLRDVNNLHVIMGSTGILLIVTGFMLRRERTGLE